MKKEILKNEENEGITIIALVITIIVLLILAGVTIATLNGNNGILTKTQEAKEKTEVANEREIVEQATLSAMSENLSMKFSEDDLQEALNKITIENITKVFDIGEGSYEVLFIKSRRTYKVKSTGELEENYVVAVKDSLPGNIETDENGNKLDGSIDKPYEINSIEDLVVFSNLTNGVGYKINESGQIEEIKQRESFDGKYVVLNKTLDFKSSSSYIDATRSDLGDINNNDTDENKLLKEMSLGTGFRPIKSFLGYFNGKDNEIRNIYIKRDSIASFFIGSGTKKIEKFTLTGEITSESSNAFGICENAALIEKCCNKAKISSLFDNIQGRASGIAKWAKIVECTNEGDVYSKGGNAGGISSEQGITIENCINKGNVSTINGWYAGGICAGHGNAKTTIKNCHNSGNVNGSMCVGGILGVNGDLIENCYNTGKVKSKQYAGGIVGGKANQVFNCYNLGEVGRNICRRNC